MRGQVEEGRTTTTPPAARDVTAAETLVASLRGHGVDRVFCVAGESYLPVLDALADVPEIDVVTCRHEGSAAFMAVADARLTGRAGICLVSRGPGVTNASIGVHAAKQDATPLVVVMGQIRGTDLGRDMFQEVDADVTFGAMAKAVLTLRAPERAAETVARAFRVAETGTPGPVIVVVSPDVLTRADPYGRPALRWREDPPVPAAGTVDAVADLLAGADRPLLIAGGRLAGARGRRALAEFAGRHGVPVVTSNKHQDLFDNRSPLYAGHLHNASTPERFALFEEADLVLAVGTRLDDVTTRRHTFPASPEPRQRLVHVYPDAGRLGLVHRPWLGVACDPAAFLDALTALPRPAARASWAARLGRAEDAYATRPVPSAGDGVVFGAVVTALDSLTGGDVGVVVDSGTFTSWVYRHLRLTGAGRLLGVTSSPMGFGVPAATAVALRRPGRPVVAVVGDGGFVMNGGELITAVAYGLPVVVIVSDNRSYATIRIHQERDHPGRVVATDLLNPDFAAVARAHGALGLTVREEGEIEAALREALAHGGPALVHVHTSLTWTTANRRLDGVAATGDPWNTTTASST